MTANDYISSHIKRRHVVAVIEDTIIETPDENLTKHIKRGVYTFTNYKEARHFNTVVNQSVDDPIAFRFNAETKENEND